MNRIHRTGPTVAFALCLSFLSTACSVEAPERTQAEERARTTGYRGIFLPDAEERPDFVLTDMNGEVFDFRRETEGKLALLFFGYTYCPDVCPATMTVLGQAKRELEALGQDPLPRVVLVSVDPERDTPEAMARYIGYFGNGNLGLTGELEEISKLTDALGIFFQKAGTEDGIYGVDHSTVVLVIDLQGRFKALFSAPHRVENLVHDLPLIMAGE